MLVFRGISMLLGVVTSIILARLLGPEDRGSLAILMISISLVCVILNFGTAEASIYLLGSGLIKPEIVISSLFYFYVLISFILSWPAFAFLNYLLNFDDLVIILLILLTSITVLNTHLRHFLIAQKKFIKYNISVIFDSILFLLGVFLVWRYNKISIDNIIILYTISGTTVLIMSVLYLYPGELIIRPKIKYSVMHKAFGYGFHLFLVGISGFGVQRITYFLIDFFYNTKIVGLYTAANSIPTLFLNLPQQLSTVLYSYVSSSTKEKKSLKLTSQVIAIILLTSGIFLLPIILFTEKITIFLFGENFIGIEKAMIILSVGTIFSGLSSVLFNYMAGTALHKYGSYMTFVNLACISLSSIILIPRFGLNGAAFSYLITMVFSFTYITFCFMEKYYYLNK